MNDLLAELRTERAKHSREKGIYGTEWVCKSDWDLWPCPSSRALDCAIAGLQGHAKMTRMNLSGKRDGEEKVRAWEASWLAVVRARDKAIERAEAAEAKVLDWESHKQGHPGWIEPTELSCEFCRLVIRESAQAEARGWAAGIEACINVFVGHHDFAVWSVEWIRRHLGALLAPVFTPEAK